MWIRSENGESVKPKKMEKSRNHVILRKNFKRVDATDDMPEHWTYDEWQMTKEQYEVFRYHENLLNDQSDALVELAELFAEQDDALVELAEMIGGQDG